MRQALRIDGLRKIHTFFKVPRALMTFLTDQLFLQRKDSFLWAPVFLSLGIGSYFLLPDEPPFSFTVLAIILLLAIQSIFKLRFGWIILIVAIVFFTAQFRTVNVNAPMLNKKTGPVNVVGTVQSIETMGAGQGSRITLTDIHIEDISDDDTPRKVRLRLRKDSDILIGQRIDVLAHLNPPSTPVYPGGFDFRRYMFFKQIGAVGFIYKVNNIISEPNTYQINIEKLRHVIAQRIIEAMPEEQQGIALALTIGKKNAISEDVRDKIRDAGLAHMLAISGLHIGIFAGTIFFIVRLFLSSCEKIALQYSSKKIAAIFAMFGAVFYMLIAGATVPTQRAVLMSGIVFLAIILDRSPISLRLVAFSALIVLLIAPESLLSASFQMSFAAVTALVYFYDRTRLFWIQSYNNLNAIKKIFLYFIGVCITTIIASIATAPFALYHFGQVSFLGSLSNLVAVPLLAFIIMPSALLALSLMPFGLHEYPLFIMGYGIESVIDIASYANEAPYATFHGSAWSFISFLFLIISMLWVIIWKGYGKIFSVVFLFASLIFAEKDLPQILVSSSSKLTGIRYEDNFYVSSLRAERFVREKWEKFYGLEEGDAVALRFKGADKNPHCGEEGCRFNIEGKNVSYVINHYAQKEDCAWADILISQEPVADKNFCDAPIIIDKFSTWRNGAYAITIKDGKAFVENVYDTIGNRPWSAFKSD